MAFYIVKKFLNWSIYSSVVVPLICSGIMGLTILIIRKYLPYGRIESLLAMVFGGGLIYFISLYLFVGKSLVTDVKKLIENIFKK